MKPKYCFFYLLSLFLFLGEKINAQEQNFLWAKGFGGAGFDFGRSVTVDNSGNIYVVGDFKSSVDFDPGLGIYNLSSLGFQDVFVCKYDCSGNFLWVKQIGGSGATGGGSLNGHCIALDELGNIYISGSFGTIVDFDPGPSVYNLTSVIGDAFICKLDNFGNFIWAKQFSGSNFECAYSLAVDKASNVYVNGYFRGTTDFDPGPGTFNLSKVNIGGDVFICKLDSLGSFVWVKSFGGSDAYEGAAIAIDSIGNIYATAAFVGTVDFDPGPGFFNITAAAPSYNSDVFVLKLDKYGNLLWAKAFGGNGKDVASSISLDKNANVFTTGYFSGTVDFDPSPTSTYNLDYKGTRDVFVSKLDNTGAFIWARSFGGLDLDFGIASKADQMGNIYTAGIFYDTVDFNPDSLDINYLTSTGGADIFISKLDSAGNFKWAKLIGGSENEAVNLHSLALDSFDNVYLTGDFNSTSIRLGTITIDSPTNTQADVFITKISCSTAATLFQNICGTSYISPSGKHTWITSGTYLDTIPNTAGCDSIITINLTIGISTSALENIADCDTYTSPSGKYIWTTTGTYMDTIPNTTGCDSIITINLTIGTSTSAMENIVACNIYTSPSGKYNWTTSGTYLDTIPNTSGCDSIITINLTINLGSSSTQTISACHNFISPSGNYIWSSSGTYLDTIPNAAGCDSIIITQFSINNNDSTLIQSGCDSLVINGQKYTSSGNYSQLFINVAGCDSTLNLNLTVFQSSEQTLQQTGCDSLQWNGQVYYSSGTYTQSFMNVAGCDSTVTLQLNVNTSSDSILTETTCTNYSLNGVTYATSGTYQQLLSNASGCDSIITLNLSVNTSTSSITQTSCDSIVVNGQKYITTGLYTQTLSNAAGCDSVITLNLTLNHGTILNSTTTACKSYFINGNTLTSSGIYHLPFVNAAGCSSMFNLNLSLTQPDTSVSAAANTLSSNATAVTYQWIDCSNGYQLIPGAIAKDFLATTNGNYAVIVTKGTCSDTSSCYAVISIGTLDAIFAYSSLTVFPNPATKEFFVSGLQAGKIEVEIYTLVGKLCLLQNKQPVRDGNYMIDVSELSAGVYLLKIKTDHIITTRKLIIEK